MSLGSSTAMPGWQRANVLAAAQYLRDVVAGRPGDSKAQAVYEGLLEVLEPARRTIRQQRELTEAARLSVMSREKRNGAERRRGNRRRTNFGSPVTVERRKAERRQQSDRRSRT
jgi:hypothetical protein